MILAEFEAYYSRPIAPTRRVSLGSSDLPVDPAPGFGGILLGAIVARFVPEIDEDLVDGLSVLVDQLERGRQISQPRLRHRLQDDKVGLQRCRHRLLGDGEQLELRFEDEKGTPLQHTLCAVYTAAQTPRSAQSAVMATVRKGLAWRSDIDRHLIAHLAGRTTALSVSAVSDPVGWAMSVLDLRVASGPSVPDRQAVQRAFRDGLRTAHPDHGGESGATADRIAELTEARRILLG